MISPGETEQFLLHFFSPLSGCKTFKVDSKTDSEDMSVDNSPLDLDLSMSYGLQALGTLFSCILWGVSCVQLFLYYSTYDNDPFVLRFLVFVLWATETSASILSIIPLWTRFIVHYGNITELEHVSRLTYYFAMLTALPISVIQIFFFHRIYIFSERRKVLLIFGIPLSLWQFTATIVYCALTIGNAQHTIHSTISPLAQHLWISTRVASVLVDVTIAVSMTYLLRKRFLSSDLENNATLTRIFIVIVNTGIWTASAATVSLILLLAFERTNLFLLIEVPMGMIYLNTFLANLNTRRYIRGRRPEWVLSSSNVPSQFTFGIRRNCSTVACTLEEAETMRDRVP